MWPGFSVEDVSKQRECWKWTELGESKREV